MCRNRVIHPILISREIATIDKKDSVVFGMNLIDTSNPETICDIRMIPNINPMFQRIEMEAGDGRSNKEFLVIIIIGLVFIFWFFIKMM